MKISWQVFAAIAATIVVLDQITKWLAVSALTTAFDQASGFGERLSAFLSKEHPLPKRAITVLENFWHFRYAENTGAAFSFLADSAPWFRTPFFLLITIVAMTMIVVFFRKSQPDAHVMRFALALVFGGAIGNFIDRVRVGYVIDFVSWHWYDKATWPTFNIADSAITVGVALLLLGSLRPEPSKV